jgi:molybdopterin/thiamine biosynthesis adenylyltransferase
VIDIIDFDDYDVNNAVRHVLEVTEAGNEKAAAVGERCRALNPFIDVRVHQTLIGHFLDDEQLLEELVGEAALIVDTTGSQTLARLLSDRCLANETPLIVAGLTAASYGGEVFVVSGGLCFDCFLGAQERGDIPAPPAGERSSVTPIGCRHPAFAGAGFEATELAAIAARTAVRVSAVTDYPRLSANWIVLDFRNDDHYRQGVIDVQPDCPKHKAPT